MNALVSSSEVGLRRNLLRRRDVEESAVAAETTEFAPVTPSSEVPMDKNPKPTKNRRAKVSKQSTTPERLDPAVKGFLDDVIIPILLTKLKQEWQSKTGADREECGPARPVERARKSSNRKKQP